MTFDLDVLSPPRLLRKDLPTARPWLVRKISMDDAATVARHRYFREEEQDEDLATYSAWLLPRIVDGRYLGSVAVAGGKVVGGAGVILLDWGPTRGHSSPFRGRVVNVFTAPEWRRNGIAKTLVTEVLSACEGLGIRQFCLGTTPAAESLYHGLGFRPYAAEMAIKN